MMKVGVERMLKEESGTARRKKDRKNLEKLGKEYFVTSYGTITKKMENDFSRKCFETYRIRCQFINEFSPLQSHTPKHSKFYPKCL